MGLTSTTIIREYIEKNVAEFDRTILEKKDEYRGILDSKNTDIILLPSGEEIVVNRIYDERNGLWYAKQDDYYLPELALPSEKEKPIGICRQAGSNRTAKGRKSA